MRRLHDKTAREGLLERVGRLRPDAQRRWGKMTVDQMLHHVNAALEMSLGRLPTKRKRIAIPLPLFKFIAFNLPWPKGRAPTAPELKATGTYDFAKEQARLKSLINEVSVKALDGIWTEHPAFGPLTGDECSRLQHKHVDHHLKQFGV